MLFSINAFMAFLLSFASVTLVSGSPTCINFTMPVTASAMVAGVPGGVDPLNPLTIISAGQNLVFNTLISGTFNIAGVYCEPENIVPARANTLQFLVHGITYTRDYWFGQGLGDRYSWALYASQQGYPTLSVDRIGNGLSEHPEPFLTPQIPLEVEIIHQMILAARAGQLPPSVTTKTFNTIIFAGHSFGSLIGNNLNAQHPNDVNATILTGYTSTFLTAGASAIVQAGFAPADIVEPSRYGNLPVGYLSINNQAGFNNLFYNPGAYDPAVAQYDYVNRGTASVAELLTIFAGVNQANAYTAPVYLMTAAHDNIFCSILGFGIPILSGLAGCGPNTIADFAANTGSLYPHASSFGYYILPTAGHCWQLHYDGLAGFQNAHNWMALHGF